MKSSLLLTDEEYESRFEGKHTTPYIYTLRSADRALVYFGARHSRMVDDEQWMQLESEWNKFVHIPTDRRVILFEGGAFPLLINDKNVGIQKFGESAVLASLAEGSGATLAWPDPTPQDEVALLREQFDLELVAYFLFARSAGAWLRGGTMGTFDEVISKAVAVTARRIGGAPDSIESYGAIHQKVFGRPLNESEKDAISRAAAPVYHDSVINDIARTDSRFRNERVIAEVERYWSEGYNIFMLFGAAHAVIQEPVLRHLVG